MGIIVIRQSSPPGVASVVDTRVVCDCGYMDKTYAVFRDKGMALAEHHNRGAHGDKYKIRDERP